MSIEITNFDCKSNLKMRAFTLLVMFLSLSSVCITAQINVPFNEKGVTLITYHTGFGNAIQHELRVENFVHPRWSLIYSGSYSYQKSPSAVSEYRFPLGCSVGVGAVAYGVCASSFDIVLLSALIPDGVAYHIYMGKNLEVSPYINVSGLMLQVNSEIGNNRFYYSPSAGLRMMRYFGEHFVLSAEQTFHRTITGNIENSIGASLSVRF